MDNFSRESFLSGEFLGNSGQEYLLFSLIFIGLLVGFKFIQVIILNRLGKLAKKTETDLDDLALNIIKGIKPPFYLIVTAYVALSFLDINPFFEKIFGAVFIIMVTYQVVVVINRVISFGAEKIISKGTDIGDDSEKDIESISLLSKVVKAGMWVVGILVVLSTLGVNITSVIAGLGIGGIAVALAVQNILSDVFSSISIIIDKPFKVGDFIVIGGKQSGIVKQIGIKTTRIKTLQGEELIVSNKDLTSERVQNFKHMERRRVSFSLAVVYGTELDKIKSIPELIKEIIGQIEGVEYSRAHFKSYGDFSLNFDIVYFVNSSSFDDYMNAQQDINLKIYESFNEKGIQFAYPTQTVFLNKGE